MVELLLLLLLNVFVDFNELAKYLELAAYSCIVYILKHSPFLLLLLRFAPLNVDNGDIDDNSLSPSSGP